MLNYAAGYHPLNNFEEHQEDLGRFLDPYLVLGKIQLIKITPKLRTQIILTQDL